MYKYIYFIITIITLNVQWDMFYKLNKIYSFKIKALKPDLSL